ncbi:MAG: ComEC/Rec2 family competence protein [Bacteroidetes bacterium]|nr:ComEC/Rec2 family competence protein [Bacteroidota bacterium]
MRPTRFTWLSQAPFIRLLLPFMSGILLQEYVPFSFTTWCCLLIIALTGSIAFFFTGLFSRYRFAFINGIFLSLLCVVAGGLMNWYHTITNDTNWFGHLYREKDKLIITLQEPPVEKPRSWKAEAEVNFLIRDQQRIPVHGKIIVYLKKDSLPSPFEYGTQLLFGTTLQEIKNTGNPGSFDYKQYCRHRGIIHQVYLTSDKLIMLPAKKTNRFWRFIFQLRTSITDIIRRYIPGEKEKGLAEAMLIGYKNDLDTSLVQSYTNTGVVHIIAISGLHLGLIYWLLSLLLHPLHQRKNIRWLKPVLIISFLWLFSLLAGAQPSVLRAALMFTFIVLGESLSRKSGIYNSLAASAFILLCINPMWLWDAGFQLSYLAVLSIILFMQPVYHLFYIRNKWLDYIWKMNAVTIAAQLLTLPLSIYQFHQFPNLFLLTNFVAVPLSSIILLGEILLCAVYFSTAIAAITGKVLNYLIWLMNTWIIQVEKIPYSLWNGLQITLIQTLLLYVFILTFSYAIGQRSSRSLLSALCCLLCFILLRNASIQEANGQLKIVVYNIPSKSAIELVQGRHTLFWGDSSCHHDSTSARLTLQPARTIFRSTPAKEEWNNRDIYYMRAGNTKIIWVNGDFRFHDTMGLPPADLLILSARAGFPLRKWALFPHIGKIIFDSSVPAWKMRKWKKECDSLQIPVHDVSSQGAFVMKVQ